MENPISPPVLLIAHPNPELYGADRVLLETVTGLVGQGSKVVVTLPDPGPLVQELERRGAAVVLCPTPVLRKSFLSPMGLVQLVAKTFKDSFAGLRLIRNVRADAVYVNTVTIPLWILLARLSGKPVLSHVHEAEKSASRPLKLALVTPLMLSTAILANSKYSADVLTEAVPWLRSKIEVVSNGVPGPVHEVVPGNTGSSSLRLLYVGRLSHRKGPDVAIKAVAEARRRGLDAYLDIVGAVYPGYEWYEGQLRVLVDQLALQPYVTFHGFQHDVWPFLSRSDAAIVPSRIDEPFGNTAVEALLAARPLIVSDTSGLREAAHSYLSTQFVPVDDPAAIANAIERIELDRRHYSDAAMEDARDAADRHSPTKYQSRVNRAVNLLLAQK